MADQRRPDYRGRFSGKLSEARARLLEVKSTAVYHLRIGGGGNYDLVDGELGQITGRFAPYCTDLSAATWLFDRLAPDWEQIDHQVRHGYHHLIMADRSWRNRPVFQNRFISTELTAVTIYTALSVYLIDLNCLFEETISLAPNLTPRKPHAPS